MGPQGLGKGEQRLKFKKAEKVRTGAYTLYMGQQDGREGGGHKAAL